MAKSKYRFPVYSFDEVASMSSQEWEEACRSCGADMKPHRDEDPEPNKTNEQTLRQGNVRSFG